MDESLKVLERYMMENGPFDGLMGFSQGATASCLIALLQQLGLGFQVSIFEGWIPGNYLHCDTYGSGMFFKTSFCNVPRVKECAQV